ncbi:MAG: hypothetical protein HY878_07060 [Deltaproteobacteria bacterium]|nr:hypothetical protein [Deltaproteobacteria bacterium]
MNTYLSALGKEIDFRWHNWENRQPTINSLYIGGGTPSLLSLPQLEHLMEILARLWDVGQIPEVTVECNPSSIDGPKLRVMKMAGVKIGLS